MTGAAATHARRGIERVVLVAAIATSVLATLVFWLRCGKSWDQDLLFLLFVGAWTLLPWRVARRLDRRVHDEIETLARGIRDVGKLESAPSNGTSLVVRPRNGDASRERALSTAMRRLETRFLDARAADERARSARKNAERARGLLFAGVSHDLKSPLNALLGFADLMTLEPLTEGQRESLDLILSRGRELVALVETILDSARVEAGQLGLNRRATSIGPILRDARVKADELVHAHKDVELYVDEDLAAISADPAHLTRAFALVIAHALKSSAQHETSSPALTEPEPKGSPEQPNRAGSSSDAVVVRTRDTGSEMRVDVEHRASGPSKAVLEEIYFTKKRGRGLRLGLRLARTILELHGGRIEVLEKSNGRPTVSCFVPLAFAPNDNARLPNAQPKSDP